MCLLARSLACLLLVALHSEMRPFGAFVLVSVLCVLSVCHCSAYVYPLAPSVGTRTAAPWVVGAQQPLETAEAYAARQLTLGVSHASNNGNEDNQLLSTPTYEAFGAAIQSVRWALGSDGANGGVVPVAASNCADRINTVLIDGAGGITATLVGVAKADKFAGMVALAQLTDPDVAGGVRILWTVSGPITDNLRNRLITVNNNMVRHNTDQRAARTEHRQPEKRLTTEHRSRDGSHSLYVCVC